MKYRILPLLWLLLFEALADYFATRWGGWAKTIFAVIAIGFYIVCNIFWLYALKNGVGLGRGNIIFAVGSSILAIGMGYLIFHESYTPLQITWLILGLISIGLVTWGE